MSPTQIDTYLSHDPTWFENTDKAVHKKFLSFMSRRDYGREETIDAWNSFYEGYTSSENERIKLSPTARSVIHINPTIRKITLTFERDEEFNRMLKFLEMLENAEKE